MVEVNVMNQNQYLHLANIEGTGCRFQSGFLYIKYMARQEFGNYRIERQIRI